jgi:hypothetical protein
MDKFRHGYGQIMAAPHQSQKHLFIYDIAAAKPLDLKTVYDYLSRRVAWEPDSSN